MSNIIKSIGLVCASLFLTGTVYAGTMSIKVEQPSPTNQTNLTINFVVLDYSKNGDISAQCSKKGPSDGDFVAFGSPFLFTASSGGGSADCTTDSSILNTNGTYQFKVIATKGGETAESVVDVVFNTSGPDTPTSYSKEDFESCNYKIKYHTGDNGNTTKVELYRSPNTTFDVNAGSLVATQNIGPDADGEFTIDKPDCSKTYYFVVRAFDSAGNGSGVRGDSETHTVNTTVTTPSASSGQAGAIPAGTAGNVLGAANGTLEGSTGAAGVSAQAGTVLGEEASPSATPTPSASPTPTPKPTLFTGRNLGIGGGLVAVLLLLLFLFK